MNLLFWPLTSFRTPELVLLLDMIVHVYAECTYVWPCLANPILCCMWRERTHVFFKCVLPKVHFYNIIPFIGLGKSCYNFTASVKLFIVFSCSCFLFDISSQNCFFLIYGFVALETCPFKVFYMYLSSGIAPSVFIQACFWLFSLFVTLCFL